MSTCQRRDRELRLNSGGQTCRVILLILAGLAAGGLPARDAPGESRRANYALEFDGADDYVEIPEIAAMRTDAGQPLTVEFWVHLDEYPHGWVKTVSKWGARGGDDDEFVVTILGDGRPNIANTGATGVVADGRVPLHTWCHLGFVWDSTRDHYQIYINGEAASQTIKGPAPIQITGEPMRIGTDGHRNQMFQGTIDELRVWNVARSGADIRNNMRRRLNRDEPGLVGCWTFDEASGQVVRDQSPRHNHGRLGRLPVEDGCDPRWVPSGVSLW
jgi:hypothetical protein